MSRWKAWIDGINLRVKNKGVIFSLQFKFDCSEDDKLKFRNEFLRIIDK